MINRRKTLIITIAAACTLNNRLSLAKTRVKYDNWKAISYAREWCKRKSNSCGIYLEGDRRSDCSHFIAHCLFAGGIKIENKNPDTAFCKYGLAVRNVDIVANLRRLAEEFDNVKAISLSDAIVGDLGFLKDVKPRHAFMVCEVWDSITNPLSTPKVYAHSTSRCCEHMDTNFRQWLSDAFRLEDG